MPDLGCQRDTEVPHPVFFQKLLLLERFRGRAGLRVGARTNASKDRRMDGVVQAITEGETDSMPKLSLAIDTLESIGSALEDREGRGDLIPGERSFRDGHCPWYDG